MLKRRGIVQAFCGTTLAWPMSALPQSRSRKALVGVVSIGGPTADMVGPLPSNPNVRAFLRGMAELGYVYGRDFVTEPLGTDGVSSVKGLIDRKVDIIVATGGGATLSLLKQATQTIPVVMTAAPDPVRQGYVRSLAHSGNNFTGMSLQSLELTGKRLQILKELAPTAERAAIFWDPSNPELWRAAQAAGPAQGWELVSVEIDSPAEIRTAFAKASKAGARAVLVPASGILFSHAREIAALAATNRMPAIYELRPFVDAGGLASYGANIEGIWRKAATYVDKLLKGTRPAELPIEQPTLFELVVNARTAKDLNLPIPPSVMIRADQVIE